MNATLISPEGPDPTGLAHRVATAMGARDLACQALGITVVDIGPGHARLEMVVREDMANGHGICHGGLIFTLADSAFAYACNSRNEANVAAAAQIDFIAPGQVGSRLVAIASEQTRAGRSGFYDVWVRDDSARLIALFRGRSARIAGPVIAPDPSPERP